VGLPLTLENGVSGNTSDLGCGGKWVYHSPTREAEEAVEKVVLPVTSEKPCFEKVVIPVTSEKVVIPVTSESQFPRSVVIPLGLARKRISSARVSQVGFWHEKILPRKGVKEARLASKKLWKK